MDRLGRYRKSVTDAIWAARTVFSRQAPNTLFITNPNRISESQIYPFRFFRADLRRELRIDFREISLPEYEKHSRPPVQDAEFVFFQPWWDISPGRLQALLERVRDENPNAKIIFLDSFAPVDLRLAQYAAPYVDAYVKKHVFRDRGMYGKATQGDTNLIDFYGKLFGIDYPEVTFPVPRSLLDGMVVGPSFATAQHMLKSFLGDPEFDLDNRQIDLHARLGGGGDDWYGMMRNQAKRTVKEIAGISRAADGAVDNMRYIAELRVSKLCFSPFGFGEVCWRDYEAVMCGALLLKPDMAHVETAPDIFRAFETYVPVDWDFSNLEERVRYYLAHDDERKAMALRARDVLRSYFEGGGFVQHVRELIELKAVKRNGVPLDQESERAVR